MLLIALILTPCRFSSSISCTSFPLNSVGTSFAETSADFRNDLVKGWGILNRHFEDFYTGRDSIIAADGPCVIPGRGHSQIHVGTAGLFGTFAHNQLIESEKIEAVQR